MDLVVKTGTDLSEKKYIYTFIALRTILFKGAEYSWLAFA